MPSGISDAGRQFPEKHRQTAPARSIDAVHFEVTRDLRRATWRDALLVELTPRVRVVINERTANETKRVSAGPKSFVAPEHACREALNANGITPRGQGIDVRDHVGSQLERLLGAVLCGAPSKGIFRAAEVPDLLRTNARAHSRRAALSRALVVREKAPEVETELALELRAERPGFRDGVAGRAPESALKGRRDVELRAAAGADEGSRQADVRQRRGNGAIRALLRDPRFRENFPRRSDHLRP